MSEKLISGDNHIDLTYLPPDLWSSEAPNKWKLLAPRVEEMDDGLHWFVDAQDKDHALLLAVLDGEFGVIAAKIKDNATIRAGAVRVLGRRRRTRSAF